MTLTEWNTCTRFKHFFQVLKTYGTSEDTHPSFFITIQMNWWGKQDTERGFGISNIGKFDHMSFFLKLPCTKTQLKNGNKWN